MKGNIVRRGALGVLGVALVAGAWLASSWDSTSVYFPPLREMVPQAAEFWASPEGVTGMLSTLSNLARGLLFGIVAGVTGGLTIGQVRILDLALTPIFEFLRSIPNVALLPFAIVLFGIGDGMKVFSIALATVWPVLLNTVDGARHLPSLWSDTARVYGLSPLQRQLNVVLPGLAPRILAGIHIAIPLALIVAVTSEMVGSTTGIGAVILDAQYTFEVGRMWSGILLLGLVGTLLNLAFALIEHPFRRSAAAGARDNG